MSLIRFIFSIYFFFTFIFSVFNYQFHYVSGSNTLQQAVYGTTGLYTSGTIPQSRTAMYTTDINDDSFLIAFGDGTDSSETNTGVLSNIFQYNKTLSQWRHIFGNDNFEETSSYAAGYQAGNMIGGRYAGGACHLKGTDEVYFFMGYGKGTHPSNIGFLQDVWSVDLSLGEMKYVRGTDTVSWSGYTTSVTFGSWGSDNYEPRGRVYIQPWCDVAGERFFVFGGVASGPFASVNDLWEFDMINERWRCWDAPNSNTVGNSLDNNGFYQVGTKGTYGDSFRPKARNSGTTWIYNDEFFLFGGSWDSSPALWFSDLWCFNPNNGYWKWLNGPEDTDQGGVYGSSFNSGNLIPARQDSRAFLWLSNDVADPVHVGIMFGRGWDHTSDTYISEVWVYSPIKNQFKTIHDPSGSDIPWNSGTNTPGGRVETPVFSMNSLAYNDIASLKDNRIFFFGALAYNGASLQKSNDLWYYEPDWNQKCYGYWSFESAQVCSGEGTCIAHSTCDCNVGNHGDNCQCLDTLCNNHGSCVGLDTTCTCDDGYFNNCADWNCNGKLHSDGDSCLNGGTCIDPDSCSCIGGYYGSDCSLFNCNGVPSNESNTCNGNGDCLTPDVCSCWGTYEDDFCSIYKCHGVMFNDSSVCNKKGECVSLNNCSCVEGYYSDNCTSYDCYEYAYNDDLNVCNSHGDCLSPNNCSCDNQYVGANCSTYLTYCDSILSTDSSVCSGHGDCIADDKCNCSAGYYEEYCSEFDCYDYHYENTSFVCSNHGDCYTPDNCTCDTGYTEKECNKWTCYLKDPVDACSHHGECDYYNHCDCETGYTDDECDIPLCYTFAADTTDACSNNGECLNPNNCSCYPTFFGDYCGEKITTVEMGNNGLIDILQVSWIIKKSELSSTLRSEFDCSITIQNDEILLGDQATCRFDFSLDGEKTDYLIIWLEGEHNVQIESSITLIPITDTSNNERVEIFITRLTNVDDDDDDGGVLQLIIDYWYVLVASIIGIVLFLFFCFVGIILYFKCREKKMKKSVSYSKELSDIDKMLEKEELQRMAEIKINKKLFEIDYDYIKIISSLGKGGSSSIVFLANWKNQKVAFKCFQTKDICGTQDDFNEFEKEVNVLASISHPNVNIFYGCTLKPPRVGIVMEYCENGSIREYLEANKKSHDEKNTPLFPLSERIRIMKEVSNAMDYLHGRNIIHRDLKSDNILLTSRNKAKIIDFGLSRIVERMSEHKTSRIGTSWYMAPEIVSGEQYSEKCDVYSFGIILFEVLSLNFRPYGHSHFKIEYKVAADPSFRPDCKEIEKDSVIPEWLVQLTKHCWDHDQHSRPSFLKIYEIMENKGKGIVSSDEKLEKIEQKVAKMERSLSVETRIKQEVEILKKKDEKKLKKKKNSGKKYSQIKKKGKVPKDSSKSKSGNDSSDTSDCSSDEI